jgi:hypothetical protein
MRIEVKILKNFSSRVSRLGSKFAINNLLHLGDRAILYYFIIITLKVSRIQTEQIPVHRMNFVHYKIKLKLD